jgi:hypothetical protein
LTKTRAAKANQEREGSLKEAIKRELEGAGWKLEVGAGGTICQNPKDAHWYDELRALAILKEGLEPGE